jgi:hypothetical protein
MDLSRSGENRWGINRVLKNLRDKYKLIDCKFIIDKPAQITLLDYEDSSKEYENPQNKYFKVPFDLLAKDFNAGKWTIMRGMRELKKLGLLDVEYDAALDEEGIFTAGRKPNKYCIKPLPSPEEIDKKWTELKNIYGEELVKKAREFAFMIEQDNNIEIVEAFIRIMGRYTEEWVEKATKITARMRPDNPSRNFGYIVGILKNWDKQGDAD